MQLIMIQFWHVNTHGDGLVWYQYLVKFLNAGPVYLQDRKLVMIADVLAYTQTKPSAEHSIRDDFHKICCIINGIKYIFVDIEDI